jgi:acetyltransferase-like isoleucine patch superfamily enzyme
MVKPPPEVIDRPHLGGTLRRHPTCAIDRGVSIDISADVTLCAYAVIGEEVLILTHEHAHPGYRRRDSVWASPLRVGRHAFLGSRTIVLASVAEIGEGAIIGAGSVLTRDVPAGQLWAGNPARFVKAVTTGPQ